VPARVPGLGLPTGPRSGGARELAPLRPAATGR